LLLDEGEHLCEAAVIVLLAAWMMLDPESPFGGRAGNLAWFPAGANDEDVQVGPVWRHRPRSVVPRGSESGAQRLTTCAQLTEAPSPVGHATLSEVSPVKFFFARHLLVGFGDVQRIGDGVSRLIEFGRGMAE